MFNILDIIPNPPLIRIIDVGAMSLGEGTEPYFQLVKRGFTRIVGFEPIETQCHKLNAASNGSHTYLPYCIGNGDPAIFHECNYPMTSSLYEPNTPLLDKFQNLGDWVRVVKKEKVKTHRLDDVPEVSHSDYIKVDVQGAEADVFAGATKLLKEIVAIQTEVEFVPLYKNQPLFADVDRLLRQNGFAFHRFIGTQGRTFKPFVFEKNIYAPMSQILWSDAVYVKDFMALDKLHSEKLLKLAIILHEIYSSYDLCAVVLKQYDTIANAQLAETYMQRLMSAQAQQW